MNNVRALLQDSEAFLERVRTREDVRPQDLTTFGSGSAVPLVYEPGDLSSLQSLLQFLRSRQTPWKIIGTGSNIILPDNTLECALIRLGREFSQTLSAELENLFGESEIGNRENYVRLVCDAASSLMSLSRKTCQSGLSGLEFAAGIPATVGGAVVMNAGAHGSEISQVLSRVLILDLNTEVRVFSKKELAFSYRTSELPASSIVIGAEFILKQENSEKIAVERSRCLEYRKRTQPLHMPSSGSVFRNPGQALDPSFDAQEETFPSCHTRPAAAQLLEAVGMKGKRRGNIEFSNMHSNWLVRVGENAASSDAHALIREAQDAVQKEYGLTLHPEVILW